MWIDEDDVEYTLNPSGEEEVVWGRRDNPRSYAYGAASPPTTTTSIIVSEQLTLSALNNISAIHRFYRITAYDEDAAIDYEKLIEDDGLL
jgi:hypothetical protein